MIDSKFRGMTKDGNMIYGWGCFTDTSSKKFIVEDNGFMVLVNHIDMFVGVKDSKEKDIYSGDLIKHNIPKFKDNLMEIVFLDGAFCFKVLGLDEEKLAEEKGMSTSITIRDTLFDVDRHDFDFQFEVVGNIYENDYLKGVAMPVNKND